MKRWQKGALGIGGVLVAGVAGLVVWVNVASGRTYEDTPYPSVQASQDPDVIERGAYIVNALSHCNVCHLSKFDDYVNMKFGDRPLLKGGFDFSPYVPFGSLFSANITPDPETGIGSWSDAEIARVIRTGIGKDGRLEPIMALAVGDIADDDLAAVVSYLRSMKPVRNPVPGPSWNFLGKLLLATGAFRPDPPEVRWKSAPPPGPTVERGEYLAKGPVLCEGCHTKRDPMKGMAMVGPPLAGGDCEPSMKYPGLVMCPPNLTPDPKTGHIASWTEERFVQRFKSGAVYKDGMPWQAFGNMTEDDLRAIYRYLKTVPAVEHDNGPIHRQEGWEPGDDLVLPPP